MNAKTVDNLRDVLRVAVNSLSLIEVIHDKLISVNAKRSDSIELTFKDQTTGKVTVVCIQTMTDEQNNRYLAVETSS